MKYLLSFTMLLFTFGYSQDNRFPTSNKENSFLEIYFLKNSTLSTKQALQRDINQLQLAKDPWLTSDDIRFYDYSTHRIFLKKESSRLFNKINIKNHLFDGTLIDKPFIVVANQKKCYVGSFERPLFQSFPSCPFIVVGTENRKDVIQISYARIIDKNDMRNDSCVKDALTSLGLYHGGISVELNSVSVEVNSDTSTVEYDFTINNLDQDNLYVIDPDKMGTEFFHYYTNGIVFSNGKGRPIESKYKKVKSSDRDRIINWLTEIKVNTSIERKVKLKGYPTIPKGSYACHFIYHNPDIEDQYLFDGRVWLGSVISSVINVDVK